MKFLKQYWPVLTIFLILVPLVLSRTFSQNNFRYDAVKWAEPSTLGSNILTLDKLPTLKGDILFINLGDKTEVSEQLKDNTLIINPELILEKKILNKIRKNRGPVILFSEDNSVSARVWMIISEMGIENVYILPDDNREKEN